MRNCVVMPQKVQGVPEAYVMVCAYNSVNRYLHGSQKPLKSKWSKLNCMQLQYGIIRRINRLDFQAKGLFLSYGVICLP